MWHWFWLTNSDDFFESLLTTFQLSTNIRGSWSSVEIWVKARNQTITTKFNHWNALSHCRHYYGRTILLIFFGGGNGHIKICKFLIDIQVSLVISGRYVPSFWTANLEFVIKRPFLTGKLSFLSMWISEFADKKSANNEVRLYYFNECHCQNSSLHPFFLSTCRS